MELRSSKKLSRLQSKATEVVHNPNDIQFGQTKPNTKLNTQDNIATQAANPADFSAVETGTSFKVGSNASTLSKAKTFHSRTLKIFDLIDIKTDSYFEWKGFLSGPELDKAKSNPGIKGEDAAAVATLIQYQDELEQLSDDESGFDIRGVTVDDLNEFMNQVVGGIGDKMKDQMLKTFEEHSQKIEQTKPELFAEGVKSIRYNNFSAHNKQSRKLTAVLASLAFQRPQDIENMVDPLEDGSYQVNFPNQKPIVVSRPTDVEVALYASAQEDGSWATVIDKAFRTSFEEEQLGNVILGNKMNSNLVGKTKSTPLRNMLVNALSQDKVIYADKLGANSQTTPMLPQANSLKTYYSILQYHPTDKTFTIVDPTGHNSEPLNNNHQPLDGTFDGTFRIDAREVNSEFFFIHIES